MVKEMGKICRVTKAECNLRSLKADAKHPGSWVADVDYTVTAAFTDPKAGGSKEHPNVVTKKQSISDTWRKDSSGWHIVLRVVSQGDD